MTVANVNKPTTESKYVSCFADSRPDVDITFRDVLLKRPTDHYLVGVDNFSMTSTNLSMIEPTTGDYKDLIRVVRNRAPAHTKAAYDVLVAALPGGKETAAHLDTHLLDSNHDLNTYIRIDDDNFNFAISSSEVILSVQQLMYRLNTLATDVCLFMNTGKATDVDGFDGEFGYLPTNAEDTKHLKFEMRSDGRLSIIGTRAFWGCFSFEIASPQYQFGFFGDRQESDDNDFKLRRFLSVHPLTGVSTFNKIKVNPVMKPKIYLDEHADPAIPNAAALNAALRAYNSRTIADAGARTARVIQIGSDVVPGGHKALFNIHSGSKAHELITIVTKASIFSTMERRVALELGASLPIKNSPMIDHGKETPDFVLARWIWRTDSRVDANESGGTQRYGSIVPACIEYQGPQDRICYQELQAQAKIQTLRIKLFARVRSFEQATETWKMRVIDLPTGSTDWWHARLHFVSKD